MKRVYKYLSPDLFEKVFPNERTVRLKASYPKEFNDPYELFLTLKTDGVDPEILAYYQETVGAVPQFPTLCFSARPDVVPMWAHYARDFRGFVLEFDEDKLIAGLGERTLEDVAYSTSPIVISTGEVAHAFMTGKPRHTYFLQRAAFNAAYFTKSSHWSYELEKRLVLDEQAHITVRDGIMTSQWGIDCVTAIIAGPKMERKLQEKIFRFSKKARRPFYQLHIGRSSIRSFFTGSRRRSYLFDEGGIVPAANFCIDCKEPLESEEQEKCHWCGIGKTHKKNAAFRNPMRLLNHLGLLEGYIKDMDAIGSASKKKKA